MIIPPTSFTRYIASKSSCYLGRPLNYGTGTSKVQTSKQQDKSGLAALQYRLTIQLYFAKVFVPPQSAPFSISKSGSTQCRKVFMQGEMPHHPFMALATGPFETSLYLAPWNCHETPKWGTSPGTRLHWNMNTEDVFLYYIGLNGAHILTCILICIQMYI